MVFNVFILEDLQNLQLEIFSIYFTCLFNALILRKMIEVLENDIFNPQSFQEALF